MIDTKEDVNKHFSDDLYWYLRENGQHYFETVARLCTGRTLDIGCGEAHLRNYIEDYRGFDLSDVAVSKVNDPRVTVGDINDLPDLGKFDTIVMCGVVIYMTLEEAKRYIENIRQKYNPSRIVIADPNRSKLWSLEELNPSLVFYLDTKLVDRDLPNGAMDFMNKRQIAVIEYEDSTS